MVRTQNAGPDRLRQSGAETKVGYHKESVQFQIAPGKDRDGHDDGHGAEGAAAKRPGQCAAGLGQHLQRLPLLRAVPAGGAKKRGHRDLLRPHPRRHQGRGNRGGLHRKIAALRNLPPHVGRLLQRRPRYGHQQGGRVREAGQEEVRGRARADETADCGEQTTHRLRRSGGHLSLY